MPKNKQIDPEIERYYRDFPEFPGVQKLIELLQNKKSLGGAYIDTLFGEFEKYIPDHLPEWEKYPLPDYSRHRTRDKRFCHMGRMAIRPYKKSLPGPMTYVFL